MRPKVIVVTCGTLALLALALYLALPKGTEPIGEERVHPAAQEEHPNRITVQVVEPQKDAFVDGRNNLEIRGKLHWVLVNPSHNDGLLSVAIKTTEDWNILLTKWDPSKRLELTISHTLPAEHVRVAISDFLGRHGPFRLEGEVSSIVVRSEKNRDPNGYGSTVRMTSGQAFFTSASLSGGVIFEFFYD